MIQRVPYSGALEFSQTCIELEKRKVWKWLKALTSASDRSCTEPHFTINKLGDLK